MSSSAELYQVGSSEKIKALEEELAKELQDLKNDIEENEMLGKTPKVARLVFYYCISRYFCKGFVFPKLNKLLRTNNL